MTTESILLPLEKKDYLKTRVKAQSLGYQRKELCKNVATSAALHHPRKDPSKSDHRKLLLLAADLKPREEQAAVRRGKRLYWGPHFHAEKYY